MSIRMSKQLRDHYKGGGGDCDAKDRGVVRGGTLYGRIRVKVLSMIETEAGNASGLGDDCDCKSHRDKDKVVDFKNTGQVSRMD
ncbi:hypothetical protein PPACK8108_LOCUS11740 [Phakopsora pachyrhizi]|uniref:Uncharacterized protein n=1 Tax=Phakopsora pachyrhizi TaxID=170000 RepID=A0AAV0B2W9_PHAPC|nr:hypothetical protein PPACK8108_LOCUS11740 [Phakopsora pachyrhizi]